MNTQAVVDRFQQLEHSTTLELTERLRLRRGSGADYKALARFHYRAPRPATMTRVWVLEDSRSTVVGRYRQRDTQHQQVVGVLVESRVALSCRMRDVATHGRFKHELTVRERANCLNAKFRVISRVVVHPQWRGLGLAVRLVKHALEHPSTRYTEALAAMGRVHPFFEKAGMTAYPRPMHPVDARLRDALSSAGFSPHALAMLKETAQRIQRLPEPERVWLTREIGRWYRQHAKRGQPLTKDLNTQLKHARERLWLRPVYYLFDAGETHATHHAADRSASGSSNEPQHDARSAAEEAGRASEAHRVLPAGDRSAD